MPSIPFIPVVAEISAADVREIPGLDGVVSFWTEGKHDAVEWFGEQNACWGAAGFAMRRGDEVLGYAIYGPPESLPRAGHYPVGPTRENAALLAYVEGDARTRRHLLVRVLRDLKYRDLKCAESVTCDFGLPKRIPTHILLESGWQPVRRRLGYTLMRADLGNTVDVEVGRLARGIMGKVRLPSFSPPPSPTAFSSLTGDLMPYATSGVRKPRQGENLQGGCLRPR